MEPEATEKKLAAPAATIKPEDLQSQLRRKMRVIPSALAAKLAKGKAAES
jgi:hypothetical protein